MRLAVALLSLGVVASPAHAQDRAVIACSSAVSAPDVDSLLDSALVAQGGRAAVEAAKAVEIRGMRSRVYLEQSVRPSPPYIETATDVVQLRAFERRALKEITRSRGLGRWFAEPQWTDGASLVSEGDAFRVTDYGVVPGNFASVGMAEESLELGPERVILTALSAPDRRVEGCSTERDFEHLVVAFTWRGAPVRVLLQPISRLPSSVEIRRRRPYDLFWNPWGEVTTRFVFDLWTREPSGLRYPRRQTTIEDGAESSSLFVDGVAINPGLDSLPSIDEATRAQSRATIRKIDDWTVSAAPVEVAPGVMLHVGGWNVVTVQAEDGDYVIDGPISDGYSRSIIARLAGSGASLKMLVTTSDAWPHIGGLAAYAEAEVPILALDLNRPLIAKLLRTHPGATIGTISNPTDYGRGPNRFRVLPYRTVTGERQMAVYWPEHRLLWTSDLVAILPDGELYLPQYADEVADLIQREGLDVATTIGMHYGPTPWTDILELAADRP